MFVWQLRIVSGKNIYEEFIIIFVISFAVKLDLTADRDMDFVSNKA